MATSTMAPKATRNLQSISWKIILPLLISLLLLIILISAAASHKSKALVLNQAHYQTLLLQHIIKINLASGSQDFDRLSGYLAPISSLKNFFLVEQKSQRILAAHDHTHVGRLFSIDMINNDFIVSEDNNHEAHFPTRQNLNYTFYSSLPDHDGHLYELYITQDSQVLDKQAKALVTEWIMIAILGILGIGAGLHWVIRRQLIFPLNNLRGLIENAETIPDSIWLHRHDELGQLAHQIKMTENARIHREKEIAEVRRYADGLARTCPVLMFYINSTQHFCYANQRTIEWSNLSKQQLEGSTLRDVLGYRAYTRLKHYVDKALHGSRQVFEFNLPGKNGSTHSRVELVPDIQDGETSHVRGIYCCLYDISESKAVEQTLQQAKDSAEQGAKAKSAFLATMSHEIRTPMNGVIGMLTLLSRSELNEDQQKKVDMAKQSAKSLMKIINDILDFSKIDAGKMSIESAPFKLGKTIKNQVELLEPLAEKKGLKLHVTSYFDDDFMVMGDQTRLEQILTNLVGNAIKFTDSGSVTVTSSLREHSYPPDTLEFNCAVKDTGIGVNKDTTDSLFDAFTQENASITRRFGGTGLGLAIVKNLCQLMGGSVQCDSEKNVGSCFRFKVLLKKAERQDPIQDNVDATNITPDLTGLHLLIAEDHVINQEVIKAVIKSQGGTFDLANDGMEVISLLTEAHKDEKPAYDAIIMDCEMPKLDGRSACKKIRAGAAGPAYKNIPIVALTAHALPSERSACFEAGMNGYLSKPIRISELLQVLHQVINEVKFDQSHSPEGSLPLNTDQDIFTTFTSNTDLGHTQTHVILKPIFPIQSCGTAAEERAPFDSILDQHYQKYQQYIHLDWREPIWAVTEAIEDLNLRQLHLKASSSYEAQAIRQDIKTSLKPLGLVALIETADGGFVFGLRTGLAAGGYLCNAPAGHCSPEQQGLNVLEAGFIDELETELGLRRPDLTSICILGYQTDPDFGRGVNVVLYGKTTADFAQLQRLHQSATLALTQLKDQGLSYSEAKAALQKQGHLNSDAHEHAALALIPNNPEVLNRIISTRCFQYQQGEDLITAPILDIARGSLQIYLKWLEAQQSEDLS